MTKIYTKNGVIQYIITNTGCIPGDITNRSYRKIMAQDAITPFERMEIPDPVEEAPPSLQDQINTLAYLLGVS